MLDIATATGTIEGIRALLGIAKGAIDAAADQKVKAAVYELQSGLYELQGKALDERTLRSDLQEKITNLKRELAELTDNQAKVGG